MRRAAKIAGWTVGALALVIVAAFFALQTQPGKRLLIDGLNRVLAGPQSAIKIGAISGFVPFDFTVTRIEIDDATGPWLTIADASLRWSPSSLLRGRLQIDRLSAEAVDLLRQPAPSAPTASSAGFSLPRAPVAVDLRALDIARLAISPEMAGGANAEASVRAHATLMRGVADAAIALARTDGQPGTAALDVAYDQTADTLALKLNVDEPTGILMDAATGRADHLPFKASLDGAGKLSGWTGKLVLSAGPYIGADAAVGIAHTVGDRLSVSGAARIGPLLAERLRPMMGESVTFDIVAADDGKGGEMLAPSSISLAAVTLQAEGARSDSGALTGKAHIGIKDIAAAGALVGNQSQGVLAIDAVLSGTADRPKLFLSEQGRLTFGQLAIEGLTVAADIQAKGDANIPDPEFGLTMDAKVASVRDAADQGADYGPLTLHLSGSTDAKGRLVDIGQLNASGAGVTLQGHGGFKRGAAQGSASLIAGDLSVLGKMFGQPAAGRVTLDIDASTGPEQVVTVRLSGDGDHLRTGIEALDAVLAGSVNISASGGVAQSGKIALSALSLDSARAKLAGSGTYDPEDRTVEGAVTASLADLSALSSTLKSPLAGTGTLSVKIAGTLDAPTVVADAVLDRLAFRTFRIDHVDAKINAPHGLDGAASITGGLRSGPLDETVAAEFAREPDRAYRVTDLRLAGTGGSMTGSALFALSERRIAGKFDARIGDLSVWSGVVGQKIAGQLALAIDVPADGRPGLVRMALDRFALGASPTSIGISHAVLSGSLSGNLARQNGALDLVLSGLAAHGGAVTRASAHVSAKGDAGDFRFDASGRMGEPFSVGLAGTVAQSRGTSTMRLDSLTAAVGADRLALTQPASLTLAKGVYRLAGLALNVDNGAIEAQAAFSPKLASAEIRLRRIPLQPLAPLAGKPSVGGVLDGLVTLSGAPASPTAHASLTTTGLDLETDGPLPRPALNLSAAIDWRGERANLDVRLSSGGGETLTVAGSAPFAFDLATLTAKNPVDKTLALTAKGGGRLENLASIAPLGEDRMSGAFSIDVAVGGTIAAPEPRGRVAITGGRYANMALGAQLDGIDLAVDGQGERFVLDHLTATDGKSGQLKASGSVDLGVKPASADVAITFSDFLVARGDDATVDADGDLKIAGALDAMTASGKLSVRHAEIYIPERLPASVVTLDVTEIGGRNQDEAPKSRPAAPVGLQIALDAPGQIFVRGHGVTSEWRGDIDVTGNTAAPLLIGALNVVDGSVNLLGQTFSIDRGIVRFDGGPAIDPVLDVQASATASSVTATVNVTGTARAPKIALSSIPTLPQDEILARVLFGSNVSGLTPSQGLQLAAAAATLAQGGPGLLDRVRAKIGLDRLDIGSGGSNPSGTQGVAQGAAVTGGKYIANGVLVTVQQGLSTNSSQVGVEVEVTRDLSVTSTFGAASGSGFGAKFSLDY
jgi:translocation and assembly module TamB